MKYFKISQMSVVKEIKEIYSPEELCVLLQKPAMAEQNFMSYRNWVLVNYFIATGNRPRSVSNIKIQDLELNSGYIKLTATKNKRQQLIPLEPRLCAILKEYLKVRQGTPTDYLFCNQYGGHISENGIYHAICKYNKSHDIFKTSLCLFRHTFATLFMIYSHGNIYKLSKRLGHSDTKITENYINDLGILDILTYSGTIRDDILEICYEHMENRGQKKKIVIGKK